MNARQTGMRVQHILRELQLLHLTGGHDGPPAREHRVVVQQQLHDALFHHAAHAEPEHQIVRSQLRVDACRDGVADAALMLPYSGGLKRNIVQCLNDFGIPLKVSHTVVNIEGRERVSGITIAEVGPDRKPIPGTEIHYDCDTLLLSCGLIPENELSRGMGVDISPVTNGPVVDESLQTSIPGVFAAGNVLHVHDLVDYVSEEAAAAGP